MDFNTFVDYLQAVIGVVWPFLPFLAAALLFFVFIRALKPKSVVAYSTDQGRVMVSKGAIVELVQTSCEQIGDVFKPSVKIRTKGHTTHFEIRIKLASGGRMRDVEQTLQEHLRTALTENLGIERVGRIDIIATGFKSGKIQPARPRASESETEPPPKVLGEDDEFDLDPDEKRPN